MIYRPKRMPTINAFKFETLNDIPKDFPSLTAFTYPGMSYDQCCPQCGKPWLDHALYEGSPICPHQYILYKGNKLTSIMGVESFEDLYILLCNEDATFKEIKNGDNNKSSSKENHSKS